MCFVNFGLEVLSKTHHFKETFLCFLKSGVHVLGFMNILMLSSDSCCTPTKCSGDCWCSCMGCTHTVRSMLDALRLLGSGYLELKQHQSAFLPQSLLLMNYFVISNSQWSVRVLLIHACRHLVRSHHVLPAVCFQPQK